MRRQFGDFYSFGLPGVGSGLYGTVYILQDPVTMARLLRHEGQYPSGAAQSAFGFGKYLKDRNRLAQHFFTPSGPEWKRLRSFVQTDLLSPASAQRYLPAICDAAWLAARGAPPSAHDLNQYLNCASFDMFSNVMIGHNPRVADPTHETDPVDLEFCETVAKFLRLNNQMTLSIWDGIMIKTLGWETARYRDFADTFTKADAMSAIKIQALLDKPETEWTESERQSYAVAAMARQQSETQADKRVTVEDAKFIVQGLLTAGVDTTGGNTTWKLWHLAQCPRAQERIVQEQEAFLGPQAAKGITPESIAPQNAPYLHACIRESHRLANTFIPIPQRRFPTAVEVHGQTLPPGSTVALDNYSKGIDPDQIAHPGDADYTSLYGSDPLDFVPERFLAPAVQARRDHPSALVLDHALMNGPFSQGARKCPGSRVAHLETAALLASLCLQWEFAPAQPVAHWKHVDYGLDSVISCTVPELKFEPRQFSSARSSSGTTPAAPPAPAATCPHAAAAKAASAS